MLCTQYYFKHKAPRTINHEYSNEYLSQSLLDRSSEMGWHEKE